MKSLSIKKVSLIVLCGLMLLCSVLLFGCNQSNENPYEEQGFTAVRSVEYSYESGSSEYLRTINATYLFSFNRQNITEDEYNSSMLETCYPDFYGNIPSDNTITIFEIGKSYKFSDGINFHIYTITGLTKECPYIKILDNNNLELIDKDGSHHIIKTTYYNIEYFI